MAAAADKRALLRKLEGAKEFGRWLGIEAKLQELQDTIRFAAWKPNLALLTLRRKTKELLAQWRDMRDDLHTIINSPATFADFACFTTTVATPIATTASSCRRTWEALMKSLVFSIMKHQYRRRIVYQLNKVINEYEERTASYDRDEDEINMFMKREGESRFYLKEDELVGRDEDVANILALIGSRSLGTLDENHGGAMRDDDDDDKRKKPESKLLTIITIAGTLGIGKTAVARKVFHRAKDSFDERIWVHVSPLFDCRSVLRRMADKIGCDDKYPLWRWPWVVEEVVEKSGWVKDVFLRWKETGARMYLKEEEDIRAFLKTQMWGKWLLEAPEPDIASLKPQTRERRPERHLEEEEVDKDEDEDEDEDEDDKEEEEEEEEDIIDFLKLQMRGKRYLLVLDDLWNEDKEEWDALTQQLFKVATACGTAGIVVIITTRSRVAAKMSSVRYVLQGLSAGDSWRLLHSRLHVRKSYDLLDTSHVKALLERCCGVPAAIHALAGYIDSLRGAKEALESNSTRFLSEDDSCCWPMPSGLRKMDDHHLSSFPENDVKSKILLERCCGGGGGGGVQAATGALAKRIKSCTWPSTSTSTSTTSREAGRNGDPEPVPLIVNPSPKTKMQGAMMNDAGLLYSLRLSYELLFPDYLRRCLMFCSLLPEDHIYDMEEIHGIWMALGYTRDIYDDGIDQFANLWDCFFPKFEPSSSSSGAYRMQPLMHELSRYLTRRDHMIKDDKDMAPESVLHLPLLLNPDTSAFPRPKNLPETLRTLILLREAIMVISDQRCKISVIPEDSLASLNQLRVLDLQCTMIKKLPRGIRKLLYLGYLNLSETDITHLPPDIGKLPSLMFLKLNKCRRLRKLNDAVTNLTSLRTLDLSGCWWLVEVPKSMENLKKLKCLNIKDCSSLDRMPRDLGKLVSLRRLPRYIVGQTDGRTISELRNLGGLEGELRLDNLEKVHNFKHASSPDLLENQMLESLALAWKWDDDADATDMAKRTQAEAVLERLRPTERLIKLEIISYAGEGYPSWMSESSYDDGTPVPPYLSSLEEIRLFNLKGCETLPPLGVLPRLRIAEISGMDAVTKVDDAFYGADGTFPSLRKLTFSQMLKLEKWLDVNRTNMFPSLTNLTIINCPKLVALEMELPFVKELTLLLNNEALYCSSIDGGLKGLQAASLKKLSISLCKKLSESSKCDGFFRFIRALDELEISGCPELKGLPEAVRNLSSIKSLVITSCDKLEALPNWLLDFTSLSSLSVSVCKSLLQIPDELRQRRQLNVRLQGCPAAAVGCSKHGAA